MNLSIPSSIRRGLAIAVAGASIALMPTAVAAEGRPLAAAGAPATSAQPCTVLVPIETDVLDGAKNLRDVRPGNVICLAAGTRGNIRVANLHGTVEQPITIRNEGGRVLITGGRFEAAIYIMSSTSLHITGTGVEARCGAAFSVAAQRCGIEIDGATKGIKVATSRGDVGELEIDHVGILRVSSDVETRGIAVHPVDRQVISGIRIHHNFVSNTGAEGIYIGSEPRDKPFEELGKVEGVEIAYNRLEQIGWDGIKMKVSLGGSSVHHNVIRGTGLAGYAKHESGITVAMSVVDVHSNTVVGSVEGIKSGRGIDDAANRFYNNIVADVVTFGIETDDIGARVFNNTVVGSQNVGIRARGDGSLVTENIIADAVEAMIVRGGASIERGNLIGTSFEVGLADPKNEDYSLRPESPAVDGGRVVNPTACGRTGMRTARLLNPELDDRNGMSRPRGCRSDVGALERVPGDRRAEMIRLRRG